MSTSQISQGLFAVLLFASGCMSNEPEGGGDINVFGRAWTFTVVSASISTTKADGTPWDADGSAPDPFAKMYLDGVLVGTTPELEDTFTPTWSYAPAPIVIEAGSDLSLDLIDSDVLDDDVIFSGCDVALTSNVAAAGGAACTGPQGSLQLFIGVN